MRNHGAITPCTHCRAVVLANFKNWNGEKLVNCNLHSQDIHNWQNNQLLRCITFVTNNNKMKENMKRYPVKWQGGAENGRMECPFIRSVLEHCRTWRKVIFYQTCETFVISRGFPFYFMFSTHISVFFIIKFWSFWILLWDICHTIFFENRYTPKSQLTQLLANLWPLMVLW